MSLVLDRGADSEPRDATISVSNLAKDRLIDSPIERQLAPRRMCPTLYCVLVYHHKSFLAHRSLLPVDERVRERQRERGGERERVRVYERERVCMREEVYVCTRGRERERVCVRESECVCV